MKKRLVSNKTRDQTEIFWPIKNLPEKISVSSPVKLTLSTNASPAGHAPSTARLRYSGAMGRQKSNEQDREALAKTMLNDILNNVPSNETNSS